MSDISPELQAHLAGAITTVARCWALTRRDGVALGFTDHDRDIAFDGMTFRADTGLSAGALQQTTGLAIDNTEALGALSAAAVREDDIRAGRYDGAEVVAWLVNWDDPRQRQRLFRGHIGEITRSAGAFQAELAGLSEALNTAQGRVYQAPCSAVLGDTACKVDLESPAFGGTAVIVAVEANKRMRLSGLEAFADQWFRRGRLTVLSGAAEGLSGVVKDDSRGEGTHDVALWQSLRAELAPGDEVRLAAGCDKRAETCREKFANFVNFRGFPHIPGEDRPLNIAVRAAAPGGGGGK